MENYGVKYILSLNSDGSFVNSTDRIYYLQPQDTVSILLDSKLIQEFHPILLTNYPYEKSKNKLKYPEAPQIVQPTQLSIQQLKEYTKFDGYFNSEFSWQCDLDIGHFNGTLFLQVVFVEYGEFKAKSFQIHSFGKPEWIVIYPHIQLKQQIVQLDQFVIQSVLPFQMGSQSRWIEVLQNQTKIGYNAFHFPPLQQISSTGNIYAIKDHLNLNQELFGKVPKEKSFETLQNLVQVIQNDLNSVCFTDIILNSTSYDTPWLHECQEAFFNEQNTPILKISVELDVALQNFSDRLAKCEINGYSKGNRVENDDDVEALMYHIRKDVFDALKLEEYFLFDEQELSTKFKELLKEEKIILVEKEYQIDDDDSYFSKTGSQLLQEIIIKYCCNFGYKRFGASLQFNQFINHVRAKYKSYSYESFDIAIKQTQKDMKKKGQSFIQEALNNIKEQIKTSHLYNGNHTVGQFPNTLVPRYFTPIIPGQLYAANFGYIQSAQNINNLIDSEELYYFKRCININCDQVKLRYGKNKKSAPLLWKTIKLYINQMASIFSGFYIENPQTLPIEASEYFIRKARNINNNLFIFSELNSGEISKDTYYCKRIGINAIIKDITQCNSGYQLYDCLKNLSINNPLGTLEKMYEPDGPNIKILNRERKTMLNSQFPKYLVYDQNIQGPTLINLYGHRQAFVNLALSSFSYFLQGSTRGYDELYANKINYQQEKRIYLADGQSESQIIDSQLHVGVLYKSKWHCNYVAIRGTWNNWQQDTQLYNIFDNYYLGYLDVSQPCQLEYKYIADGQWLLDDERPNNGQNHVIKLEQGIEKQKTIYSNFCQIRSKFNAYKKKLDQYYLDSQFQFFDNEIITITREHQNKIKSYFIISRAAFKLNVNYKLSCNIVCPGVLNKVKDIYYIDQFCAQDKDNNTYLNGLSTKIYRSHNIREYAEIQFDGDQRKTILHFFDMPPGLVIILKCNLDKDQKQSITKLKQMIQDSFYQPTSEIHELYQQLSNCDINYLLFSTQEEELSRNKTGLYQIPNKSAQTFAGFAGFFVDMKKASVQNNINLSLFENIREGNWLFNYIIVRLKQRKSIEKFTKYVEEFFDLLKKVPRHNIAYYFCLFIRAFKFNIRQRIHHNMIIPAEVFYSSFHKNLIMACYQFISDAPLYLSNNNSFQMTAGLPNFSTDQKRVFGRDTFISFKGCLLIPGLFKEAKQLILYYGSLLRHSLIPNKNTKGIPFRYNCRDVCWWYIKAIFEYVEFTKDPSILQEQVKMAFVDDDQQQNQLMIDQGEEKFMKIHQIIQAIFQGHAKGIKFTEWNSGPLLNSNMNSIGFQINLFLDDRTGFIIGGNQHNALTWMDTIGSSSKGSNQGQPACYRDGAPIEVTALLKHCLNWVIKANEFGIYPDTQVTTRYGKILSFVQWSNLIDKNFEKFYWIPMKRSDYILKENLHNELQAKIDEIKSLIKRKGIYKDTVLCQNQQYEFWLRPNGCIAITLAPELFNRQHALMYLASVEAYLMDKNSIGIKTLDKKEESLYCGQFNATEDTGHFSSSIGFNLFNGPEWVFLYGFHLRGLIKMNQDQPSFRNERLMSYLSFYKKYIKYDEYLSLPSFTNENGQACKDSCPTRAISISQAIEVCYDIMLHYLKENQSSPTKIFGKKNVKM